MILNGDARRKAYSKNNPSECSFEELVTLLCTADGKGAEYKLRCVRELLSYNDQYIDNFRNMIDDYFTKGTNS